MLVDLTNVFVVLDLKSPTTITLIYSFLSLCSYYRRFILNFNRISLPLTKLMRKDMKFEWSLIVAYASRQLKSNKVRYSTHGMGLASKVYGVKISRNYLYGASFEIFLDYKRLKYLLTQKHHNLR